MAKLVYKGKIKGNDVKYKEGCINYHWDGGSRQNIMSVVTETGKEFRFRDCSFLSYILDCLEENKSYTPDDDIDEVIIKEKGKKTLKYDSRNAEDRTVEGKRTKMFLEKANELYNEIRQGIFKELKNKPKDKKLEKIIITNEQIQEEVDDAFNTDTKVYGMRLYKDDTKKFVKFFSKIDKNRKKGLLNEIFSCDYDNKEVIEWLNKNEADLLREVGFNG